MHHPRGWFEGSSEYLPGQILAGKYLLLEPLGIGGMGQVWTAQNLATDGEVAVKLLLASRTQCPGVVERFRREAHATAQLAHRGIVRVFDLVELEGGSLALIMERLRGRTLADHLDQHSKLSPEETLGIVLPVLGALQHAHAAGIVHRDLKPENIFLALEPDGAVIAKLLDFGVSKRIRGGGRPMTDDGFIVGTPAYMAPEQVRGGTVDGRTDIFCVGILLYMCLTGTNPYAGTGAPDSASELRKVFEIVPEQPKHVPGALWKVIARALAQNPDDRFESASELATALSRTQRVSRISFDNIVDNIPGYSRTSSFPSLDVPLMPSRPRKTAGLAVAAGVMLIGLTAMRGLSSSTAATTSHATPAVTAHASRAVHPLHELVATRDRLAATETSDAGATVTEAKPAHRRESWSSFIAHARALGRAKEAKNQLVLRDPGF